MMSKKSSAQSEEVTVSGFSCDMCGGVHTTVQDLIDILEAQGYEVIKKEKGR